VDPSDARAVIGRYDDYPELMVRWYQYATFTPTMRAHGSRKETEVWSYGKGAEAIIARYLQWRYELLPYIYSLGKQTYDTGAPFMRALFMDFPQDPRVANIGDEYMFGPAMLIAPVTEQGVQSRMVYLPAGSDWYNFWTNEKVSGGQTVRVPAPIDVIPVFVRAGSILPLGAPIPNTSTPQPLQEIRVYRGPDAEFPLFDDDGVSYAYENGGGTSTRLTWNDGRKSLRAGNDRTTTAMRKLVRVIE
jgi:alpha-D-xyloside xylohydrolase